MDPRDTNPKIKISSEDWDLLVKLKNDESDLCFWHIYRLAVEKCISGEVPHMPSEITNDMLHYMKNNIHNPNYSILTVSRSCSCPCKTKPRFNFSFNCNYYSRQICYEFEKM
jgi:hypothetical protein